MSDSDNSNKSGNWNRRDFLRVTSSTALLSTAPFLAGCGGNDPSNPSPNPNDPAALEMAGSVPVSLTEGTNIAVAVSPDGKTIAMDLQGILWALPIAGGDAKQLTGYFDDIGRPHWSPDGKTIVFQSYRDGNFHLWSINADGSSLKQLTDGPFDDREPRYSPDGTEIAFSSDRTGTYAIHAINLANGKIRIIADTPDEDGEPVWSPDGKQIAFSSSNKILVAAAAGNDTPQPVVAQGSASAPSWTPDGRGLIYRVSTSGTSQLFRSGTAITAAEEEAFPFPVSWLSNTDFLYTADGRIRRGSLSGSAGGAREIPFKAVVFVAPPQTYAKKQRDFDSTAARPVKGICSPVLSPDSRQIAFVALNQVWVADVSSGTPRQITSDGYYKCHPSWSPDGQSLSYSTDRSGKFDIWIQNLSTGAERRLTKETFACHSGTWSPDGSRIAFIDMSGNIFIADTGNGKTQKVIGPLFTPGRPSWSPDSNILALSAIKPYSSRYREGVSAILTIDLRTNKSTYNSPVAFRSMGPRGDDGPIWSPDGSKMAFTMGSTLWVMLVDASGNFKGAPVQINNEVTDAPSWNKDSSQLLYLSNAQLRMIPASGGTPRPVPLNLSWTAAKPVGTTVVRAGKLWDGRSPNVSTDMDIVINGNRIVAVEPHKDRTGVKWIDASNLTVIPGMMDVHAHMQGKHFSAALGDREGRIFLSFGLTTTRGPAELAYHSVEHKEAIDSGARLAPRHFSAGEALDGSKIYYDVMRSIVDDKQLELELQRAAALDYDFLKCYVRMPLRFQKRAVEFAHQNKIHATTHYLFPWVSYGGDGHEHMGATSRFGYSRTVSALGSTYQDILAIYGATKATRTPTIFSGLTDLLGDTPGLLKEPRMTELFPYWQYDALNKAAQQGPSKTNAAAAKNVQGVLALLQSGAKIMQGTDFYIVGPAVTVHLNMRTMVKYGMSPFEALRAATSTPGDFLGQGTGAIEAGKLADLVFVEGNPLQKIEDAANVKQVMLNGFLHTMDDIIQPFLGKEGVSTTVRAAPTANAKMAGADTMLASAFTPALDNDVWWHDAHYVQESMKMCCVQV